jgi:hypothetical protein
MQTTSPAFVDDQTPLVPAPERDEAAAPPLDDHGSDEARALWHEYDSDEAELLWKGCSSFDADDSKDHLTDENNGANGPARRDFSALAKRR